MMFETVENNGNQKKNPDSGFEVPASTRNTGATDCDKW